MIKDYGDFGGFLNRCADTADDGSIIAPLGPTDWYYRTFVPKDPLENLRFRRKLLKLAYRSPRFARELWIICSRDLLFYINSFGWLLEPRSVPSNAYYKPYRPFGDTREIPFLTRPYQDEVFLRMWSALGKRDMVVLKSREVGASWIFLYVADHAWRFRAQTHIGMATKDENTLDAPGSTDALFWKLDFINDNLPWFLSLNKEDRTRNQASHIITNKKNSSTIQGWAATATVGTGGRKEAVFLDEVHKWSAKAEYEAQLSLQHVTNCRVNVSTPFREKAQSGAFYDMCQRQSRNMERFEIHWTLDEEKSRGLYTSVGKKLKILDTRYNFPPDYPFVLDGKKRSPYYDDACERALLSGTAADIATELDMDFGGAGNRLFDPDLISGLKAKSRRPVMLAKLAQDKNGIPIPKLRPDSAGDVAIWLNLKVDDDGFLIVPPGRYSIGCDIAFGTGGDYASQSAAVGLDIDESEQVFEWVDGATQPTLMADIVWCLGHLFRNEEQVAYVIPETNGAQGDMFAKHFLKRGYSNPYLRKRSDSRDAHLTDQRGQKFGLFNQDAGLAYLKALEHGIQRNGLKIYSARIIDELSRYQLRGDRAWHPHVGRTKKIEDKSHGDCAIAAACAWWGIRHMRPQVDEIVVPKIEPNTAAFRRLEWLREQAASGNTGYWAPHNGARLT
jgi:hypothetical protein